MKQVLPLMLLLFVPAICFSQNNLTGDTIYADTSSHTVIERVLRQTNVMQKVEYIDVERVRSIYFQLIVITNLKTNEKTKGLYISNDGPPSFTSGFISYKRHAYLDEREVDELIGFFEHCDQEWKSTVPKSQTHYELETADNLRFSFWTRKNSKSWSYSIKFSNYRFNNTETLGKSQSDDLYAALKQVKEDLEKY